MLFLTKKTIVSVLALGCLLSIAPKAHAELTGKKATACALASFALYEALRDIDHTQKDKHALLKAHDVGASYWQSILNTVTSKRGIAGLVGALGVYAIVAHGSDAKKTPLAQYVLGLVTLPPTGGSGNGGKS